MVQTLVSAISLGTELLFYRGQAPTDLPVDETIAALSTAQSAFRSIWLRCGWTGGRRGCTGRSRVAEPPGLQFSST